MTSQESPEPSNIGGMNESGLSGRDSGFVEGNARLGPLSLEILVAVQADLHRVRKVGADLEEERPEVPVDAVRALRRFSVRMTGVFSCAFPTKRTPSVPPALVNSASPSLAKSS